MKRKYHVTTSPIGIHDPPTAASHYFAYLQDYSPDSPDKIVYVVEAESGREAKRIAKRLRLRDDSSR